MTQEINILDHHKQKIDIFALFFILFISNTFIPSEVLPANDNPEKNEILQKQPIKNIPGKEIILGATLPLKSGLKLVSNDIRSGYDLVFNKINKSGGIKKSLPIKFYVMDDENKSELKKKNIESLITKTDLIISPCGLETTTMLEESSSNPCILFPFFATPQKVTRARSFFFRPPKNIEIYALLKYSIDTMLRKNIAIFYEDSITGENACDAAKLFLESRKIEPVAIQSYPQNSVGVMNAVKKISEKSPNAILCLSHCYPTYNFIQQMINNGFSDCLFLGLSELTPIQEILKKARGIKIVLSSVVPNPWKSQTEIAKQYRTDMQRFMPKTEISSLGFEAYINATLLCSILETNQEITSLSIKDLIAAAKEPIFKDFVSNSLEVDGFLSNKIWLNTDQEKNWDPTIIPQEITTEKASLKDVNIDEDIKELSHENV